MRHVGSEPDIGDRTRIGWAVRQGFLKGGA